MRSDFKNVPAERIAQQVVGIDIHPLSVQIAKTTVLLGLADLIRKAKAPVTLHIYLANSLLVPRETADLFQSVFKIAVDNKQYSLDISGLQGPDDFDRLITFCDDLVSRSTTPIDKARFAKLVNSVLPSHRSRTLVDELFAVYTGMKRAHDAGRNSIWKFILQNAYKPVFLRGSFDIVLGNPPWLTYSDIGNADYQDMLRSLADGYGVTPSRRNMPHLEIAAVFLAHAINYFLHPNGRVVFVMPRSIMAADQHENTRNGDVHHLQIDEIWDLKDVEPLFRVPSCVVFARMATSRSSVVPKAGIPGKGFGGRLARSQLHWEAARTCVAEAPARWYYSKLQKSKDQFRSAFTLTTSDGVRGRNAYADLFKQGSSIVPRSFYFVDLEDGAALDDLRERVIAARTSNSILRDAKAPWKDIKLEGRLEGRFLFRTLIAKNVLPFCAINPPLCVLPVSIETVDHHHEFVLQTPDELLQSGAKYTSKWFWDAERLWESKKTEKASRSGMTFLDRLDFQRGITDQDADACYLVLFCRSAQDGNAVTIDTRDFDLPFVADFATYWCGVRTIEEAHYLTAYLNSGYTNTVLKEFQTQGLFGARDVTKKIVEIPFPRFDRKNDEHLRLANLGAQCAKLGKTFARENRDMDLDARSLGRARSRIRESLEGELAEIDVIVESLSTGKSQQDIRANAPKKSPRRKGAASGRLFE